MKYSLACLMLFVLLLSGCSKGDFQTIEQNHPFIGTVNLKDSSLSFFDGNTYKRIGKWKIEKPFTGALLLPDQDSLMVYGKRMKTADIYSLKKGKKLSSWNIGEGIVNAVKLSNKEIALVDQNENKIRFFNVKGKEIHSVRTGKHPLTIQAAKRSGLIYVVNFGDTKLTVIDTKKYKVKNEFKINTFSTGALLREEDHEIWIGGHGKGAKIENNIHVYSLPSGTYKRSISAPTMPIQFAENPKGIFVVSHGTSTLYKINKSEKTIESLQIGSNPFSIINYKDNLLLAGYDSNDVFIINPDKFKVLKEIKSGNGPFQLFVRE